ncbi:MAG: DUF2306 domain-containing protein [Pseudomonadota bacterium]
MKIDRLIGWAALAALPVIALPFILHAIALGWAGLTRDLTGVSRFFTAGSTAANTAIFGHMVLGAVITALAPLQLIGPMRRRWPALHRLTGRLVAYSALAAGLGGLIYIIVRGTIGGPWMSMGFAIYGCLTCVTAAQTLRFGHLRQFERHRRWAVRLFVLAMASWIYRLHYTLWYVITGGLGTTAAFTGAFDRIQVYAFFVPYLALAEYFLRRTSRRVG